MQMGRDIQSCLTVSPRLAFIARFIFVVLAMAGSDGNILADDAAAKPRWAKELKYQPSASAHYQVGVASNAQTPEAGLSKAYNNAIANLLRATFPERQRLQESSSERLRGSDYSRQYDLDTGDIRLTGVEEATDLGSPFIETKEKDGQEIYNVYRLLRWKVADIEAERRRLSVEGRGTGQPAVVVSARLGSQAGTSGELNVFTEPPGADITLDGSFIGKSPSQFKMVGSGTYDLTLSLDGYEFKKESVTIVPGQTQILKTKLPKLIGELSISSSPDGARVLVDGIPLKQRTPATVKLNVGEHLVRVEIADFQSESRSIRLDSFPVPMEFALKYEPGILSVTSEPSGAMVRVDGNELPGSTPRYNLHVSGGARDVTVSKDGYENFTARVTVLKSKGQSIRAKLVPLQIASKTPSSPSALISKSSSLRPALSAKAKGYFWVAGGMLILGGVSALISASEESAESKAAYTDYQNAKNSSDAVDARKETEAHDARAREERLNGTIALGLGGMSLLIPAISVDVN